MMKKAIAGLMALAMVLPGVQGFAAIAEEETVSTAESVSAEETVHIWDGTADVSWFNKDNVLDHYEISTPEQLAGLSELVGAGNAMENVRIDLVADLTLNDTTQYDAYAIDAEAPNVFRPIGSLASSKPFSGVFNGNGHTIDGLFVNSTNEAGLFGYVFCGAVLRTVLTNGHVTVNSGGSSYQICGGGIAGAIDGALLNECEYNGYVMVNGPTDILNGYKECYAGGIIGMSSITNTDAAGAFLLALAGGAIVNPALLNDGRGGMIQSSGVINCVHNGVVYGVNKGGDLNIGGVAGYFHTGQFSNCAAYSDVYTQTGFNGNKGKFAGQIGNCTIQNCLYGYYLYSESEVSGLGSYDPISIAGDIDREENASQLTKVTLEDLTALEDAEFTEKLGDVMTTADGQLHPKSIRSCREEIYGAAGDTNGDECVDIIDVIMVNKYILGASKLEESAQLRSDISGNGVPDSTDSLSILKYVVEITPELKY